MNGTLLIAVAKPSALGVENTGFAPRTNRMGTAPAVHAVDECAHVRIRRGMIESRECVRGIDRGSDVARGLIDRVDRACELEGIGSAATCQDEAGFRSG